MCSVVGGMASRFVDRAVPSQLIPFRGEFPLLDEIEARRFREAIRSTMWIEELSPKFLYAAVEGSRMYTLEAKFLKYLWSRALTADDFTKLEAAERSDYFRNWMDTDAVCDEEFVVRKYRDKCQSVPAPFSQARCHPTRKAGNLLRSYCPTGLLGRSMLRIWTVGLGEETIEPSVVYPLRR